MYNIIIFILLGLFALTIEAQAQPVVEQNHIIHRVMLDSTGRSSMETVSYFDRLGRKYQTVLTGASPSGTDISSLTLFNRAGRPYRQYNPVAAGAGGGFLPLEDIVSASQSEYSDNAAYSETVYEDSPFDRHLSLTGAGQAWHSRSKAAKTYYHTNVCGDSELDCRMFTVSDTRNLGDTTVVVTSSGSYPTGRLYVTQTEDEDGKITYEFTDMQGRKLLSRVMDGSVKHDTYYIYDACGNLTAVLSPKASANIGVRESLSSSSTKLSGTAYFYIYDWQQRCRAKKLPGCAWQLMAYDRAGRLVYSQDGNLRKKGRTTFVLGDAIGRECVSGTTPLSMQLSSSCLSVPVVVSRNDDNGSLGGYSLENDAIIVSEDDLLKVTYYDDYSFIGANSEGLTYHELTGYDSRYVSPVAPSQSAKGMVTGKMTRVLNTPNSLLSSTYYDYHGNVIQTHEQNLLGGYEHYYYHLSFTGKPLEVRHEHTTADTSNVEILRYTYDNMERLLTTSVERDGAEPVLLCSNTYDDLGRLATQSLGGTAEGSHAESLAYTYNVRGWTTGITGTNFSQTLHYEDAGENACYNGNIGYVEWSAKELIDETTRVSQQYSYTYDGLNRLVSAAYSAPGASDWDNTFIANNPRDYSSSYTYDLNGNLTAIKRKGISGKVNVFDYTVVSFGDIDDLSLEYNGNQLKKVSDQCDDLTYEGAMEFKDGATKATEYTYDANGNMTCDRNKGIQSITYNMLNLPQSVMFDDGHETRYTYAADGRKLKVEYLLNNIRFVDDITPIGPPFGGGINPLSLADAIELPIDTASISVTPLIQTLMTRDYCGNHIYRNGVLERVLNDVGYADSTGYHYQVKDYRGDVRAVVAQNGTLEETNSYYPYGMLHGTSAIASTQPYKYTGKELDRENGLDWYDFEARMLDPIIGLTTSLDPKSAKYYPISPYAWCAGSPIRYNDVNGKDTNDCVRGTVAAIADNFTGGITDLGKLFSSKATNQNDYKYGQMVGNNISILIGATEMLIGGVMIAGGDATTTLSTAAIVPSGGTSVIPLIGGISISVEGTIIFSHGAIMMSTAIKKNGKRISSESGYSTKESEHRSNTNKANREKHENGKSRKQRDKGKEKGDKRRKRYK